MELTMYATLVISLTGGLAWYLTMKQQHAMEKRADLIWWKIGYMEARGRYNSYIDVSVRNVAYYDGFNDGLDTKEYVNKHQKGDYE